MGSVAPTGSRVKMRRNIKDIRSKPYGIGDLSGRTGVNIETIRYYERIGIMPEPPRSAGRQRVYDSGHIKRLAFIRRSRELGFSLDEVRALLTLVEGGDYTCGEVHALTLEIGRATCRDRGWQAVVMSVGDVYLNKKI